MKRMRKMLVTALSAAVCAAVGGQTIITCCTPPDLFPDANIIAI